MIRHKWILKVRNQLASLAMECDSAAAIEGAKIRKEIISALKYANHKGVYDKHLAWLEKQGEHAKFIEAIQVGDQVTKNEDGVLVNLSQLKRVAKNQGEQQPANKVEPKFKVGDWAVSKLDGKARQISEVHYDEYNNYYVVGSREYDIEEYDRLHHLWTIKDAKEGDVLSFNDGYGNDSIELIKSITDKKIEFWFCLTNSNYYEVFDGIVPYTNLASREGATPATKEQCDLLFSKMEEAGYEWDAEKKELKKIEQNPTWSEEDERMYRGLHNLIYSTPYCDSRKELSDWLNSLKDRVLPKQEWSEEDKNMLQSILDENKSMTIEKRNWLKSLKDRVQLQNIAYYNPYKEVVESIAKMCKHYDNMDVGSLQDFYDNVKVKYKYAKEYDSLFPQSRWKQSDEQMKILNEVLNFAANHESPHWNDYIFGTLNNLIRQLKKL